MVLEVFVAATAKHKRDDGCRRWQPLAAGVHPEEPKAATGILRYVRCAFNSRSLSCMFNCSQALFSIEPAGAADIVEVVERYIASSSMLVSTEALTYRFQANGVDPDGPALAVVNVSTSLCDVRIITYAALLSQF